MPKQKFSSIFITVQNFFQKVKGQFYWISYLIIISFLFACGLTSQGRTANPPSIQTPAPSLLPTITSTATISPAVTATVTPVLSPTPLPVIVSVKTISAPSLRANLLKEPDEQAIQIYLPPSYLYSNLHYPVVYFLPGFGSASDGSNDFFHIEDLTSLMSNGQIKEMIIVVPNGTNVLHGSFYVNSPVTGNWEDFITKDVVDYIDSNYRTIPTPEGRGIGGHSMGGFGAFNLAMHHPDIFGASYSLSPTFFDENGLGNSLMFDREKKSFKFLEVQNYLATLPDKVAIEKMTKYDGASGFTMAYGAAFAPNPNMGPPFFDYPLENINDQLLTIKPVWNLWQNGLGDWPEKIAKYHDNLMSLHGIVVDYGSDDSLEWIPVGSEYLSKQLSKAGIPNKIYKFEGGHSDKIHERLFTVMLPFFSEVLTSPGE